MLPDVEAVDNIGPLRTPARRLSDASIGRHDPLVLEPEGLGPESRGVAAPPVLGLGNWEKAAEVADAVEVAVDALPSTIEVSADVERARRLAEKVPTVAVTKAFGLVERRLGRSPWGTAASQLMTCPRPRSRPHYIRGASSQRKRNPPSAASQRFETSLHTRRQRAWRLRREGARVCPARGGCALRAQPATGARGKPISETSQLPAAAPIRSMFLDGFVPGPTAGPGNALGDGCLR
jgi:hypothetical protein